MRGVEKYFEVLANRKRLLQQLLQRYEELSNSVNLHAVDYSRARVQTTPKPDKQEAAIVNIAETERQIRDLQRVIEDQEHSIAGMMQSMDNDLLRQVVDYRFRKGMSQRATASVMGVSSTTVKRYAIRALDALNDRYGAYFDTWLLSNVDEGQKVQQAMQELAKMEAERQQLEQIVIDWLQSEELEAVAAEGIKARYIPEGRKQVIQRSRLQERYPEALRECTTTREVKARLQVTTRS